MRVLLEGCHEAVRAQREDAQPGPPPVLAFADDCQTSQAPPISAAAASTNSRTDFAILTPPSWQGACGSAAAHGSRQFCVSLRTHPWRLHCRALTRQTGWPEAAERSSFQVGMTLDPHSRQGASTWARRCALFMISPQRNSAEFCRKSNECTNWIRRRRSGRR